MLLLALIARLMPCPAEQSGSGSAAVVSGARALGSDRHRPGVRARGDVARLIRAAGRARYFHHAAAMRDYFVRRILYMCRVLDVAASGRLRFAPVPGQHAADSCNPTFPIPIETRALGTLAYIRRSIDASASMAVPGTAGVVMGLIGLLAAVLSSLPHWGAYWLRIWICAGGVAAIVGGALMAREAAQSGPRTLSRSGAQVPALSVPRPACRRGAHGRALARPLEGLLPGTWLLLYGCAVLSASTVTIASTMRLLCIMGALFVGARLVRFRAAGRQPYADARARASGPACHVRLAGGTTDHAA